ncbi:MAG: uracil-DNA glycosylase [Bacteroidetes bacterium]|nr:uracil-DNA glycosylase [Bacteroidota bacterium]
MEVKIEESWKQQIQSEFNKDYFENITEFIKTEKSQGKIIYPPGSLIFNAFEKTPFNRIKVLLLGQDPYHGKDQAMGLSFSVPKGVRPPPSLINIFKELHNDVGIPIPQTGDLTLWAEQGVMLLNAALTVREGEPNAHAQIGWHQFTDAVIKKLSDKKNGVVFLLWGSFAQKKQELIDQNRHFILKAAHPSPYSADKGFFGCRHFSKTNQYLIQQKQDPIDWAL